MCFKMVFDSSKAEHRISAYQGFKIVFFAKLIMRALYTFLMFLFIIIADDKESILFIIIEEIIACILDYYFLLVFRRFASKE